jgi:tripartite-type tricarboxylate transporter receptor subunit TctC
MRYGIALLFVVAAIGFLAWPDVASAASGEGYPSRPVRLITGFAPRGGSDILARAIGRKLTETWGQQVVVDNRPGAETVIATELAARSPSDGYTLFLTTASFSTNPSVHRKLPYDSLRDLAPVTLTAMEPYMLVVHPSLPGRTVQEFIAYAKANSRSMNYGSGGTQNHLAMEWFKLETGARMTYVPYRGVSLALTDLMGGQIQCMFITIVSGAQQIGSGKLRILAVTSARRSAKLPEVSTIAETTIPDFDVSAWNGVVVPAAVPPALIARLHRDIVAALRAPEVREVLSNAGGEIVGSSPAEFSRFIRKEMATWEKVVKAAGVQR